MVDEKASDWLKGFCIMRRVCVGTHCIITLYGIYLPVTRSSIESEYETPVPTHYRDTLTDQVSQTWSKLPDYTYRAASMTLSERWAVAS